ncbi:MAG: 2Fe-2S ferredoxin [Rickettsiales bacterium]|nr:2Fe-2S ferredoxin [Rickettsiales bacterium]|tara:strand:+ start:5535 stop:5831 length:297 start_codon:yes stop_codon:yes gene_type:complete
MPKVTFQPSGKVVEVETDTSVLEAALENDIHLEHACGGFAACTTCHVLVEAGSENLSEIEEDEEDMLDTVEGGTLRSRLGCQARIQDDVIVTIPMTPY